MDWRKAYFSSYGYFGPWRRNSWPKPPRSAFRKQRLALAKQQPKAAPAAGATAGAAGTAAGAGATASATGATATAGAPAGVATSTAAAVPVIDPPKTPEELDALAVELVKAHQVGAVACLGPLECSCEGIHENLVKL